MTLNLSFKKWLETSSGTARAIEDPVPDPDSLGKFRMDLKPLPGNRKGMKKSK
jgi:hypothetical protein